MNKFDRIPRKLELGKDYLVYYTYKKKMNCRFIQPTKCGFNFLDLETNKCILPKHLYPSKCKNHLTEKWFWISRKLKIE